MVKVVMGRRQRRRSDFKKTFTKKIANE